MYWLFFVLVMRSMIQVRAAERPVGGIGISDIRNDDRTLLPDESLRKLVESLLERVESQDSKIQSLEKMVKDNVEDLQRKEIRISQLERQLKSVSKQSSQNMTNNQITYSDHATKLPEQQNLRNINVTTSSKKIVEDRDADQTSRIARVTPNGAGAFSVSLSARDMVLHPSFVIAFDEVLLDADGNYHTGDGVYRVPVTGVYVFTWCMTGTTTDNVVTELTVNGSPRGTIFSDAETGHTWDTSTGVIVTSVSEGDHVFIRSKFNGIIHSSDIYGKSMFSGWRLT